MVFLDGRAWLPGPQAGPGRTARGWDRSALPDVSPIMNFSITGSIGMFGGWILFCALMIAFIVAAALIVRTVRGQDDTPMEPGRVPEEDELP